MDGAMDYEELTYVPDEDELDIEQGDMEYPEENEDGES